MRCQQRLITSHICAACTRTQRLRTPLAHDSCVIPTRHFFSLPRAHSQHEHAPNDTGTGQEKQNGTPSSAEEGAMSRRLSEMADEAMLEGGKSVRKNLQEASFSEDLKKKLEERIAESTFRSENAAAFSLANLPANASRGTQDIAAATPWTGTESIHDVSLRMLNDASKPMRVPFRPPQPGPKNIQPTLRNSRSQSSAERLAAARDGTSTYAQSQNANMSDQEREAIRRELQERFMPVARAITPQGLSSLANERIEDAIARGQFRNIKRGKGINIERDHNASSPYIDTTEYLLNKIIQKQDITPPWIEKQQELAKEIERFRRRLRSDWRGHAARLIVSHGGSLDAQMRRARAYAVAESRLGNTGMNGSEVDASSSKVLGTEIKYMSQISLDGRLCGTPYSQSRPKSAQELSHPRNATPVETATKDPQPKPNDSINTHSEPLPSVAPLRDPEYLKTERQYHELTIKNINSLIRSYNLMAPAVAQKPYLKLERELLSCYADVAPTLSAEVRRRATERSHDSIHKIPEKGSEGGFLNMLTSKKNLRLHEEDPSKRYGFKQFWRDLWNRNNTVAS
ncbi:hypothetical protein ACO22_04697 [Paracoccidioides brasiliensis]|uniref:DnaJ homologue subfamily C member 28 conserved domain-containing protein n=1 Tax=Paracoccidioides brasiliensis TaxID=121759 RepID=A0A1D2JCI1_PARBR|nr:hypothetical protein ACO22_04697 [Paracoccidioides brasiliensis]